MRRFVLAAAAVLAITTGAGGAAHAMAAPTAGGPITTRQLEQAGGPAVAGPSTSTWEYWCSNDYTGHFACDFYPGNGSNCNNNPCVGTYGDDNNYPGYTFRYSSKYLLLYNHNNGCLHIVKSTDGDYMNVVTCNTGDKNQRWSFPDSGLEIKSSGDDACVQLYFQGITGSADGYVMGTCNASQSYQNWKWFS